jgi:thiol-disulfide isomerase/thioredoxin/CRISPR/Cas system-associated endoribonuclease Cas2
MVFTKLFLPKKFESLVFVCLIFTSFFFNKTVNAQLILTGKIEPSRSDKWGNKLYILRIDRIGLSAPIIVDSIQLKKDGTFRYTFNNDPQGILYEIRQPIKGRPLNATISGFEDHWFYISTEEKGEVRLKAYADSLYYSVSVLKGEINKKLLLFRDIKRPVERIARLATDSLKAYPSKKEFYIEKFLSLTISEADLAKKKITSILDTCKNISITLLGIRYLNEVNFGNLTGDQIKKYSSYLGNDDILLIRNTKRAINEVERNRIGVVLPNIALRSNLDKKWELSAIKSKFKVLDFWASWCGPCRYANKNQLPEFNLFLKANDIPLIGITIDKDEKKWKEAVKNDRTTWYQFIDSTYIISRTLDVQGVPSYLVLGENNEVIYEAASPILIKNFLKGKVSK